MRLDYTVDGKVSIPGFTAQVISFDWPYDDDVEVTLPVYAVTYAPKATPPDERTTWRLPHMDKPVVQRQFGLLPPNVRVRVRRPKGPSQVLLCLYEPQRFERAGADTDWNNERLISILSGNDQVFHDVFNFLIDEVNNAGSASEKLVSALADWLRIELDRGSRSRIEAPARDNGLLDWQLRKIFTAIEATESITDVDIDQLAKLCRISTKYLVTKFRMSTGITLYNYLEKIRIDRTKALIVKGNMDLSTIAEKMGFCSASHMSASFKRLAGIAPSQFRAMARQQGFSQEPTIPHDLAPVAKSDWL